MKITDIKTFAVSAHVDNWVFCKIYTDEGVTGLGECSVEGREQTVMAAVGELKPYLVGKDPFDTELHFYRMYRDAYWGSGAILSGALSAVDCALWDIKGKALGLPVHKLLGGKVRDKIRVYANRWFFGCNTPDALAKRAAETVEAGYTALKWDPFGQAEAEIGKSELKTALEEIKAVRGAVGNEVDILIEGHGRFNAHTAINIAREIAEYRPMFFEEPVMPENLDQLAEVHQKSPVPIAAGERFYSKYDFNGAISKNCIDYAQPDIRIAGGITETKKIAALAEANFVQIAPHNIHGQVGTAHTLQLVASIPNACILEYSVEHIPHKSEIFDRVIKAEAGYIKIPDEPGIGLELFEEHLHKYPHRPMSMIEKMFKNEL